MSERVSRFDVWARELAENKKNVDKGRKALQERNYLIVRSVRGGMTVTSVARLTGLSRTSIYNIINKTK